MSYLIPLGHINIGGNVTSKGISNFILLDEMDFTLLDEMDFTWGVVRFAFSLIRGNIEL